MIVTMHLGASSMVVAACEADGQVIYHSQELVSRDLRLRQSYESLLQEIEASYDKMIDFTGEKACAVVLTTPVPINWARGIAGLAPGMPAIQDRSLKSDVESRLSKLNKGPLSIFVENDANAAALASHRSGKGSGCDLLVHVRISTGLGGCILVNGLPFGGSRGLAGEVGHVILQPSGILCGCGCVGCAETMIGGSALLSSIKRNSTANHRFEHFLDAVKAAENGDLFLREELIAMGHYLGLLLASISNILNPSLITLSGPLLDRTQFLYRSAVEEYSRRVCVGLECSIQAEEFGVDAHAIGGLAVYKFQNLQNGKIA